MNISIVKAIITEEDILNGVREYVKIDGFQVLSVQVNELIEIKATYKKGITIPLSIELGFGNVKDNTITLKLLKLRITKIGLMKSITNLALKKLLSSFKEFGVIVKDDIVKINLETLTKSIPLFNFSLQEIMVIPGGIEVTFSNVNYSKEKVAIKAEKEVNTVKVQDKYSHVRADISSKVPERFESIIKYAMVLPDISVLFYRLLKDKRVSLRNKITVGAAIAYLVSPIDLLPDFIPFIGQVDDIAIAFYALNSIINDVPEEIILENWQGEENIILLVREGLAYISTILGGQNIGKFIKYIKGIEIKNKNKLELVALEKDVKKTEK